MSQVLQPSPGTHGLRLTLCPYCPSPALCTPQVSCTTATAAELGCDRPQLVQRWLGL